MVIRTEIVAEDPMLGSTTLTSTVEVNMTDPRWPAWLVDVITYQAQESARRLRDQLVEQQADLGDGSVPLAAAVPTAGSGR